jgi:hypothetical protein
MKSIFVLLLCLGLAGCATTEKRYDPIESGIVETERKGLERDAKLNTWIGESEDSLIATWGKPSLIFDRPVPEPRPESSLYQLNTYLSEGKKVLIYYGRCNVVLDPPTQITHHSGRIGNTPFSAESTTTGESKVIDFPWTTDFIIDKDGRVEKWFDSHPYFRGAYPPSIPTADKAKQQGNP